MSASDNNPAPEASLEETIARGGEVKIHGRTLGQFYSFFHRDARFAELLLEGMFAERAFYDVGDVRFDIFARRASILLGDWTVLARAGGNAAAELRANWARGEGELITRHAHRYLLTTTKGPKPQTAVVREVGDRRILTLSCRGFPMVRPVTVFPSDTPIDEFHTLLCVTAFYLTVVDNALAATG